MGFERPGILGRRGVEFIDCSLANSTHQQQKQICDDVSHVYLLLELGAGACLYFGKVLRREREQIFKRLTPFILFAYYFYQAWRRQYHEEKRL